jgi:hypothetical protein
MFMKTIIAHFLGLGGLLLLLLAPIQNLQASSAEDLRTLYAQKDYAACYQAAMKAKTVETKSALPAFYAAVALCHYDEDKSLRSNVDKPWGRVMGLMEHAKQLDRKGTQLANYRKGLGYIQQTLFNKVKKAYLGGKTDVKSIFDRMFSVFGDRDGTWKNYYSFRRDLIDEDYDFREWDHPYYRLANSGIDFKGLDDDQRQILLLHNLARMNPPLFEKTFLKHYIELRHFTVEGDHYLTTLIAELKKATPAPILKPDADLLKASSFHARDLADHNIFQHESSDGTSFSTRLTRFKASRGSSGENCQAGYSTPLDVFMDLLIDSGIPSKGHRYNIMNAGYGKIGIGIATNSWKIWVFDFCS